jgi:hypothetical protein
MSVGNTKNPSALEVKLGAIAKGIQTLLQPGTTYVVSGSTMTGAAMAQLIVAWLAAFSAHEAAVSQETTTLKARKAIEPQARAFCEGFYAFCVNQYGADSVTLKQFGFTPKKPRAKLTSQQQVIASAKATATRQERGTLGKKQKQAVKSPTPASVTVKTPVSKKAAPPSP